VVRLEKRGLIKRVDHPDDGRSWLVELTAKGRSECAKLDASLGAHAVNLLGCVPATQRSGVEQALIHLRDALSRCLVECVPEKPRR
jgi:DNA-binding MarR family transcriptional regulator